MIVADILKKSFTYRYRNYDNKYNVLKTKYMNYYAAILS